MFCGKAANDNIDRVHKRALRILLDNHESTLNALPARGGETNIRTQCLRMLMIEKYFIRKDVKYDLRTRDLLQVPATKNII